jgi:hypothetical protein
MGEAENIIRRREEKENKGHTEIRRDLNVKAAEQIKANVPIFLNLMKELSYPAYDEFITWEEEEFVAWKLFDHLSEGYVSGKRLYLLSSGVILQRYPDGTQEAVDFKYDIEYAYSTDIVYNAQTLQRLVDMYT